MPYAVIDVETGGLHSDECALIQVGCVIADDEFNKLEDFCSLVKPNEGLKLEEKAMSINKIDPETLKTAPSEIEVLKTLNLLLKKYGTPTIVGFNLAFDLQFIKSLAHRNKGHLSSDGMLIDIAMTARDAGLNRYSLKGVCEDLGITLDKHHNALADAHATLEIAKKLLT